jgi:hypothetical protein
MRWMWSAAPCSSAGDAWVMVEEPGWAVEFARLDALGMRILPVPRTAQPGRTWR